MLKNAFLGLTFGVLGGGVGFHWSGGKYGWVGNTMLACPNIGKKLNPV